MGTITQKELASKPDTPSISNWKLYPKEDGYYVLDDAGNEVKLGSDLDAIHDNVAGEIAAITEKTTPTLTDLLLIEDAADSNNKKKIQIGNIPATDWTTSDDPNSITPIGNKEVIVGLPEAGRELVAGQGDSYVGLTKTLYYTYNGSTYTDVTANGISEDGSQITFPSTATGNMIYMASILTGEDSDKLQHFGAKLHIDTAAVLGSGDIAFEYWNGTAWTEFNHMSSQASDKYLPFANEKFEQAGVFHYMYAQSLNGVWMKNDPMSLGTDYYWVRYRITSSITTSPEFDRIKLHSNRFEANEDGFTTYYGSARARGKLDLGWGNFAGAANSPSNQNLYLSDNLDIGYTENAFLSNALDRIGFKTFMPQDVCTSCPLTLTFAFVGDSNEAQANVDFTIRWAILTPTGQIYESAADAPTTATGEQSISGSYPMPLNSKDDVQYVSIPLDVSEYIPERSGGFSDMLFVTFERNGTADAYGGAIFMVEVEGFYSSWKRGGHA